MSVSEPSKEETTLKGMRSSAAFYCAVAACLAANAAGYGMQGRTLNDHGRLPSLRYLHIPKTGTSFIIALRNYLDEVRCRLCGASTASQPFPRSPHGSSRTPCRLTLNRLLGIDAVVVSLCCVLLWCACDATQRLG